MEFRELQDRAMAIRQRYAALEEQAHGRSWTREEVALGFVGDVGDLMKLVQAEEGVRAIPESRQKMAHELADCLWCIITLARLYEIDLEAAFGETMDQLERTIPDS